MVRAVHDSSGRTLLVRQQTSQTENGLKISGLTLRPNDETLGLLVGHPSNLVNVAMASLLNVVGTLFQV